MVRTPAYLVSEETSRTIVFRSREIKIRHVNFETIQFAAVRRPVLSAPGLDARLDGLNGVVDAGGERGGHGAQNQVQNQVLLRRPRQRDPGLGEGLATSHHSIRCKTSDKHRDFTCYVYLSIARGRVPAHAVAFYTLGGGV